MTTFRAKLFVAVLLVVSSLTALGIYLARNKVTSVAEHDLQQNFEDELSWLHRVQDLRRAVLAERCRTLAVSPRIHAALEDNGLDLLYPSAKDELRELMGAGDPLPEQATRSLRAKFCRFLDAKGAVIPPPNPADVGLLSPAAETALALKSLPIMQQLGYVAHDGSVDEVTVQPIYSSETGEAISALVIGFKPLDLAGENVRAGMQSGVWVNGQLDLPSLEGPSLAAVSSELGKAIGSGRHEAKITLAIDGEPYLLFYKRLHADSLFSPAYEICLYSMAESSARLHRVLWQFAGIGTVLLLCGLTAANVLAVRFARPVEKLAVDSEYNRAQRNRAEAELATTSEALQRSSRYSADASHQLKNPLSILRAGLDRLLQREDLKPEVYEELSTLLHQTHRLAGVIDDLLLLSRLDAGHLEIAPEPVNLNQLMEGWLDDFAVQSDDLKLDIERDIPPDLRIAGEKRYISLIIQNLLENARRYNRPGGRIRITARREADEVTLRISNTGTAIAADAQETIFERFHRWNHGSGAASHGLGLNLARELARLHHGELRLVHSENDWTEFEVHLPACVANIPARQANAA